MQCRLPSWALLTKMMHTPIWTAHMYANYCEQLVCSKEHRIFIVIFPLNLQLRCCLLEGRRAQSVLSQNEHWHRGCRVEQGLTSPWTHNRSYRVQFLHVKWPIQLCQSTEGRCQYNKKQNNSLLNTQFVHSRKISQNIENAIHCS